MSAKKSRGSARFHGSSVTSYPRWKAYSPSVSSVNAGASLVWARPRYGRSEVNSAGRVLSEPDLIPGAELDHAFAVASNWRSSHSYPLNAFQIGLRQRARKIERSHTVAQRLKRFSSIRAKLLRFPDMKLSQMQDIGGCRAVVSSCAKVVKIEQSYKSSRHAHELIHEDDYISTPKESGYRGVHLIYRFASTSRPEYNGLKIEVQLRSKLQHAWATAVETVGTLVEQPLKSSIGEEDWLQFFALMGSAHAIMEGTPTVPGVPSTKAELKAEIESLTDALRVETVLTGYGEAIQTIYLGERQAPYYLLELRPSGGQEGRPTVTITGFEVDQLEEANAKYLEIEKGLNEPGAQAVLVSVESLKALRTAYPNYFLDTRLFLNTVRTVLGRPPLSMSNGLSSKV